MSLTDLCTAFTEYIFLIAISGVVATQSPDAGAELGFRTRFAIRFGVAFFGNLLLGGALITFGPNYARTKVSEIRDDPVSAFVWGLKVGIGGPIVCIILVVTVIGILVAIPGLLLLALLSVIGSAVTVVWIGSYLSRNRGGHVGGTTVLVGAFVLAIPESIPVFGNAAATLLAFFGLGVVGRGLIESWR